MKILSIKVYSDTNAMRLKAMLHYLYYQPRKTPVGNKNAFNREAFSECTLNMHSKCRFDSRFRLSKSTELPMRPCCAI